MPQQEPSRRRAWRSTRTTKLAAAALGGAVAGATRAAIDWLVRCLTTS
jgi:hypothetical protein